MEAEAEAEAVEAAKKSTASTTLMETMMAYLEVHDGIPWSPWWHTLKTMMAFLEDHDGKEKRIEFINKLNYELISQNTSWKELIKERVVFPKYAIRQSWTIGQGQYWRKKKFKNAMDRRTNISVVTCLQLKRGEWSSRKKLNSRNNSRIPKMSWIKKWDSKKFESNSYKL